MAQHGFQKKMPPQDTYQQQLQQKGIILSGSGAEPDFEI